MRVERSKEENAPVVATRSEQVGVRNKREAPDIAGMTFEHVRELLGVGV